MTNTLIVKSVFNPDWNGSWIRRYVVSDLVDLGFNAGDAECMWEEYVLDHVFDNNECDTYVKFFLENADVLELRFKLGDDIVELIRKVC